MASPPRRGRRPSGPRARIASSVAARLGLAGAEPAVAPSAPHPARRRAAAPAALQRHGQAPNAEKPSAANAAPGAGTAAGAGPMVGVPRTTPRHAGDGDATNPVPVKAGSPRGRRGPTRRPPPAPGPDGRERRAFAAEAAGVGRRGRARPCGDRASTASPPTPSTSIPAVTASGWAARRPSGVPTAAGAAAGRGSWAARSQPGCLADRPRIGSTRAHYRSTGRRRSSASG